MTRSRIKRRLKRTACVAGILALLVTSCCVLLGIGSKEDVFAYYFMVMEDFHPVWRALALRQFESGDELATLVAAYPPLLREDFSPYTMLTYEQPFASLVVAARDDRLFYARAASCTWEHTFFEDIDESLSFDEAYAKYIRQCLLEAAIHRISATIRSDGTVLVGTVREMQQDSGVALLEGDKILVEVVRVIHGSVQPGELLQVPSSECSVRDLSDGTGVFLHLDDRRVIYPQTEEKSIYVTVPMEALERYSSMGEQQLETVDTRYRKRSEAIRRFLEGTQEPLM